MPGGSGMSRDCILEELCFLSLKLAWKFSGRRGPLFCSRLRVSTGSTIRLPSTLSQPPDGVKLRVEMRPRRIRPKRPSGQSIPDLNRISQVNAANEAGQGTKTKVLKQGNPVVRIDPQPASFKNRGEHYTEMAHCFVKRTLRSQVQTWKWTHGQLIVLYTPVVFHFHVGSRESIHQSSFQELQKMAAVNNGNRARDTQGLSKTPMWCEWVSTPSLAG